MSHSSDCTILSTDPFVATYEDFITKDECQHFIDISNGKLKRAMVSNNNSGTVSAGRTGSNTWIPHNHDDVTQRVAERIATLVGMPLENAEKYQIIHYDETQQYRQHYDSWPHDGSEKTLRCMKYGGARIKTALCYLNTVPQGGGTKMTKLNITIPATQGKLLVFANTVGSTHERHNQSEHAGLPVETGEKYAFNLWFRECKSTMLYRDFNPAYYVALEQPTEKPPTQNAGMTSLISHNAHAGKLPVLRYSPKFSINDACRIHSAKDMFKINSFFKVDLPLLLSKCTFSGSRRNAWLKLYELDTIVSKIEKVVNIDRKYYENINIVEYKENALHRCHFNAYNLTSYGGIQHTHTLGQRIITVSLFLTDNVTVSFPSLNVTNQYSQGDVLIYNNVRHTSVQRDPDVARTIISTNGTGYLANIYVRMNSRDGTPNHIFSLSCSRHP